MLTDFANLLYPLKTKMILLFQKVLPTFSPELELVKMNLFKRFLGHLGLVSCGTWEHRKVKSVMGCGDISRTNLFWKSD